MELLPPNMQGMRVLDLGCGEGKNAEYLAARGAKVVAVDLSDAALANARAAYPSSSVAYYLDDIRTTQHLLRGGPYDIVIMYGVLHCMASLEEAADLVRRVKSRTSPGGYNVVCAFNARHQDLSAHPGFSPLLLQHEVYLQLYQDWELHEVSDRDLFETHPHNGIPHTHSMTRFLSQKRQ
jgi:2-polyprenyl-3-methyl-5-hydroxy-6-metoxy-1,4-benzoquinol methylase